MTVSPVMGADPDYMGWARTFSPAVSRCDRHMLVVPEAAASMLINGALRPYQNGVCRRRVNTGIWDLTRAGEIFADIGALHELARPQAVMPQQ